MRVIDYKNTRGRPDVKGDIQRIFEVLFGGGIAIVPNTVGYGIFGGSPEAMERIHKSKGRAGHKRHALMVDLQGQREIHTLNPDGQAMVECLVVDYNIPIGVVGPFRTDHPFMQKIDPQLLKAGTANETVGMLINAGRFHEEIGRLSRENLHPVFGSSANRSGTGPKFRVEDIQPEIRETADLIVDYGLRPLHYYNRSSTGINFETLEVIRIGSCYDLISGVLQRHFGVVLPADPGIDVNPSGHLLEFKLKDAGVY